MTTGRINQVAVRNMRKTCNLLQSQGPFQVGAAAISNTRERLLCYRTCRFTIERRSYIQLQPVHMRERLFRLGHRSHRQLTIFLSVDVFSGQQRDTIARTLEPTRKQDSRNVLGPITDHRPCCRDLLSRTMLLIGKTRVFTLSNDKGVRSYMQFTIWPPTKCCSKILK